MMVGGRTPKALVLRRVPKATTTLILLLLLALLLLCYCGAEALVAPIRFTGTALRLELPEGIGGCSAWWVSVESIVEGALCSNPERVLCQCPFPAHQGYCDPGIRAGDRVEVYGISYWDVEFCSVQLDETYHYIRRVSPGLQFGCIEGWVRDSITHQPIPGARVEIISGSAVGGGTSDSNGYYRICNLPPDDYRVAASKDGYNQITFAYVTVTGTAPCDQCEQATVWLEPIQTGDCSLGSWVEGVLTAEPVIDYPPDYGHFPMRITRIHRDGGALYVGQHIDVRVSYQATKILAPLHSGDTVEVCAGWDSELYVSVDGYVRKVQGPTDHTVSKPNTPSGPSSGECDRLLTFSTGGASCNQGHSVQYRFDFGDGTTSSWSSSTTASHSYSAEGTYYVKAQARCANAHSIVSSWSSSNTVRITCVHTVSKPTTLSGPSSGECNDSLTFSTGGASCNQGHSVQYRFDFGDGSISSWSSSTSASHTYSSAGTYHVKAQARCASDHSVVSAWSDAMSVQIECKQGDAPFIRDWLILGPFTYSPAEQRSAFDKDYIGETTVTPALARAMGEEPYPEHATLGGEEWREHHDADDYIDLDKLFTPNDYAIAYAHVYVKSPKRQQVQLRMGSDDAIKAWVNGELVHSNYIHRAAAADQDIMNITLEEGWNRLLLKVLEQTGDWGFYARLTDVNGDEPTGVATNIRGEGIFLHVLEPSVSPYDISVDGWNVQVDGVVTGASKVVCDWGDGSTPSWGYGKAFPFEHIYGEPGEYEIQVEASNASSIATQAVLVSLSPPPLPDPIILSCQDLHATIEGAQQTWAYLDGVGAKLQLQYWGDCSFITGFPYVFKLTIEPGESFDRPFQHKHGTCHFLPQRIEGYGMSSLQVVAGGEAVDFSSPVLTIDGTTYAETWLNGIVDLVSLGAGSTIKELIVHTLLRTLDKAIVHEFFPEPSAEMQLLLPSDLGSSSGAEGIKIVFGGTNAFSMASASRVEFTFCVWFNSPGTHSIVIVPDLRYAARVSGCAPWLASLPGGFEFRREIILQVEVEQGIPQQMFGGSNFSCQPIGERCECSLSYDNQLGEEAKILFLYRECDTGRVISHPVVPAPQGEGTVQSSFSCTGHSGEYCISWRAHRASDTDFTDPVSWSKSYEEQRCNCGGTQNTGCIEGTVETTDGLPVPNVRVKIKPVNRSDWTDLDGEYKIDQLSPGGGYTVKAYPGSEYVEPDEVTGVTVTANDCYRVDFNLERDQSGGGKGCIKVKVEDEEGIPVAGVRVELDGPEDDYGYSTGEGIVYFCGLPEGGGYTVEISDAPTGFILPSSVNATVESNSDTWIHFTLEEPEPDKPDLIVDSVSLEPSTTCPGGSFFVNATITNIGDAQAKDYRVCFFLTYNEDDVSAGVIDQIDCDQIDSTLDGSSSEPQAWKQMPDVFPAGQYWIVVRVEDCDDESNEDNNIGSAPLYVGDCLGPAGTLFQATGPVELVVTDPEGRVLDQDALKELGATYAIVDLDDDNVPDVELTLLEGVIGTYQVLLVPRAGAEMDDSVSLQVTAGNNTEVLTEPGTAVEDIEDQTYTYESTGELTHAFRAFSGLNFVSLGMIPQDGGPGFMDEPAVVSLRHWNAERTAWEVMTGVTELEPMAGCYLWADDAFVRPVTGMPLEGAQALELPSAGWQQIGVPYEIAWGIGAGGTLSVAHGGEEKSLAGAVEAGWIHSTTSAWDAEEQEWIEFTGETGGTLDPWAGYWIYTFVDDVTLHFSQEPSLGQVLLSSSAARPAGRFPTVDEDDHWDLEPSPQQPSIRVINAPNPVRYVDTTTFMVKGICPCRVFGLMVSVYGLDGRLVWEGRTTGPELEWHTEDETGQWVANGMYIYVAQANIDGQWIPVEPGKLAVLR